MLTTLLALTALLPLGRQTPTPSSFTLVPTDDVWVYSHASDPAKDEYIRVWGADSHSVAPTTEESEEFSYGYMRWDVSGVPKDKKLTEAKLVLMTSPDPGYTVDYAKSSPLEARGLKGIFSEKTWDYDMVREVSPEAGASFGSGSPASLPGNGKPVEISIDLLKGGADFRKYLTAVQKGDTKALAIALTSKLDPNEVGQKGVYKFYSRNATDEKVRPKLKLVFADGTGLALAASATRSR